MWGTPARRRGARPSHGTRSSTSRLFGQITPKLPGRRSSASRSSRNRAAETRMAPSPGSSAPSGTWTKMSVAIFPFLTSGIDPLPERFDAEPLHRVDEELFGGIAQRGIGFDNVLDHVGAFRIRHRGTDQGAHRRVLVGAPAD